MDERIPKHHPAYQQAVIEQILKDLRLSDSPVPGARRPGEKFHRDVAVQYLAGKYGIAIDGLSEALRASGIPLGTTAPLDLVLKGGLDGKPWADAIDYYDVPRLKRILLTACLVVVSYLSGMRAEEVRALKRGCCTQIAGDDGSAGYIVQSRTFKAATDSTGNMIPEGQEREVPWHVVSSVANGIAVAESLHTDELLFPHALYGMQGSPKSKRSMSVTNERAKTAIKELVVWCNTRAAKAGRLHERIPEDPAGDLTLRRFRRTLAWFIYRLPGGRVALGIQYGHLHSYTFDGYGSRVSAGLRDLFPMEEAFSISDAPACS